MSRLAAVGDRIYISCYEFCDAYGRTFDNVLHIFSEANRTERRLCKTCATGDGPGLIVRWSEGEALSAMGVPLDEVVAFARRPGRLLIHCAAASCRSPMLAILAKIARGCRPFEAVKEVCQGVYEGYGEFPILMREPMLGLLAWADSRKWGPA
jgi:hypothetical protein